MKIPVFSLLFAASLCFAAPPTVYRCDFSGKVNYSDSPCVGGKIVDVTPTQRADKMTGRSIKGNDVRREEYRSMLDNVTRPFMAYPTRRWTSSGDGRSFLQRIKLNAHRWIDRFRRWNHDL